MVRDFDTCLGAPEFTKPAVLFQEVRRLGTEPDPRRIYRSVPDLDTESQKEEFCVAYDEMIRHYQALAQLGSEPEKTGPRQKAVAWLNTVFATEPLVKRDGQLMLHFYFQEGLFTDQAATTRDYYKDLVAANALSLVIGTLNQQKRARGLGQTAATPPAIWHAVSQTLTTGMYQPPESSFTKQYVEETIRFPLTLSELYLDIKAPSKHYTAAVAACKSRPECRISMESIQMFEQAVRASTDELRNHSINSEELLACYTCFELLPNQAKRALKNSQWWSDILTARDTDNFKILDEYPAPQLLSWKHLIDTLVASFFPNQAQPNRYLKMYWGIA